MATEQYECSWEEDLREIARIKVNENPEERENAIEKMRIWVKKENLVRGETCTDTVTLLKILRFSKFDLAKSRARFQLHYKSRMAIPQWFLNRDPLDPIAHQILKLGLFVPLKYDHEGRRIILNRLGHYDASVHSVHDVYKVSTIVCDYISSDERTQINGFVNLCDFSQFGRAHAVSYMPVVSQIASLMQDCVPARMKNVYCWNTPIVFTAVYNLAKFFLSKKTKRRFHFLSKSEKALHAVVPPECLPTEYGGSAGPLQNFIDSAVKEVLSYRERLMFDDNFLAG